MTAKEAPNVQKDKEDRKKEWLEEMVPFEFMNLEEPGVPIKFSYGPTNKPKTYYMMHGGKYTYPRKIMKHLESRQIPIWGYKPDGNGRMEKTLKGYKSRFQCRQTFE
jgi:hypothetical protein